LHGEIGWGVSLAAGITIGIIVDDTMHLLVKYTSAKRQYNLNTLDAVTFSLPQVGPALVFTTIVLVSGFLSIAAITDLTINGYMSLMTALVLSFALLFTVVVLLVLLMLFVRDESGFAHSVEPGIDVTDLPPS
jgi:predicted RND superfamily exporter protein